MSSYLCGFFEDLEKKNRLVPGDFFIGGLFRKEIDPFSFRVHKGLISGVYSLNRSTQVSQVLKGSVSLFNKFEHNIHPSSYVIDVVNDEIKEYGLTKNSCDLTVVTLSGEFVGSFSDMVVPHSLRKDFVSGSFYGLSNNVFSKHILVIDKSGKSSNHSLAHMLKSKSFGVFDGSVFGLKRFGFNTLKNVFYSRKDGVSDSFSFENSIFSHSLLYIPCNNVNGSSVKSLFAGVIEETNRVILTSGKYFDFKEDFFSQTLNYDSSTKIFYVLGKDKRAVFGFKPDYF